MIQKLFGVSIVFLILSCVAIIPRSAQYLVDRRQSAAENLMKEAAAKFQKGAALRQEQIDWSAERQKWEQDAQNDNMVKMAVGVLIIFLLGMGFFFVLFLLNVEHLHSGNQQLKHRYRAVAEAVAQRQREVDRLQDQVNYYRQQWPRRPAHRAIRSHRSRRDKAE